MKDYYKVLKINEDSSPEVIKKSYRQLSKEYHPDKTKGDKILEEKFKEVAEAYETLGDSIKKRKYDDSRKVKHTSFDDFVSGFSNFASSTHNTDFGSRNFRRSGFSVREDTSYLDVNHVISIDIKDIFNDDPYIIEFDRVSVDDKFNRQLESKKLKLKINLSEKYADIKKINGVYTLIYKIKALGNQNHKVMISRGGNTNTIISGDLIITVNISTPDYIKINNNIIEHEIDVQLYQVLVKGEKIRVETIFGKKYDAEVNSPESISSIRFNIPDDGLMLKNNIIGNYVVKFNIILPKLNKLSKTEFNTLKKLLSDK